MKLKQKLARQSFYELKSDYSTWDEAFIVGFEKAREMAAEKFQWGLSANSTAIHHALLSLGEEEIEDAKPSFRKPLSPEESRGV